MAGIILIPVFVGWFLGLDPNKLTGIVGLVFGAFCTADAFNTYSFRKFNGTGNGTSGG